MGTRARSGLLAALAPVALLAVAPTVHPPAVEVPAGTSVTAVARLLPDGATLRLGAGTHRPFTLGRRVTVLAAPGATAAGPVRILADGVALVGLRVVGGESGVSVVRSTGVTLDRVAVRGATMHGIEVEEGSATIRSCVVGGLSDRYGQGVEIRNSAGLPPTVVEGCRVSSGQEGIVSHVSRVLFRGNHVTGTTLRAVVVTEMSEGVAEANVVRDVAGAALFCGDMSNCEFRSNVARRVEPNPMGGRSAAGYGAVAWFHSNMRLAGNTFEDVAAGPVRVAINSHRTDRFPLSVWPTGWRGALPALPVGLVAMLGLVAVRGALHPAFRRAGRRGTAGGLPRAAPAILAAGFAVQTFHMLEHGVQIFQIHVADAQVRSGLAGARVDTEWVHFAYNAAVLGFLVWASRLLRPGRRLGVPSMDRTLPFLWAATLVQAYHLAEHVAKVAQHLNTGVDPAPGLLGDDIGLVWFHFGINLAVYAGMAAALVPVLAHELRRARRLPARAPALVAR